MIRDDSRSPRASQWLAGGKSVNAPGLLALLGVPLNNSVTPGRCDLAPEAIRSALEHYRLHDCDARVDLGTVRARDFGNVQLSGTSVEGNFFRCVDLIKRSMNGIGYGLLLGGDNSVTRPGLHAMGVPLARCGLITFDAHHDVSSLAHGLTNANPVSALLRDGLPGCNVVQIGIQPFVNSAAYARLASDAGINIVTADEVYRFGMERVVQESLATLSERVDAIYVDMDMDVLDRAYAPACPGSRPGGLQPWMLRAAARICGQHERVRIMDLVEIDPTKDIADATVLAAASCFLAFVSGLASRFLN